MIEGSPRRLVASHNVFRATCTITGKVCKVIIDGGSTDNFTSKEAVTKLQLKVEKHLEHYKLFLLKKGSKVVVDS